MARERAGAADQLVLRVAAGQSLVGAAKALGFSRRTAQRRAAEPTFREAVRAVQQAWAESDYRHLCRRRRQAVRNLVAKQASADDRVSLNASVKILELGLKLDERLNLHAKLDELERAVAARNRAPAVVVPPPAALPPPATDDDGR